MSTHDAAAEALDLRLAHRKEHLMQEMLTDPATATGHRHPTGRRLAAVVVAVAALGTAGAGIAVASQSQSAPKAQPNVIVYKRYQQPCSGDWSVCAAGAAHALGHSVLMPTGAAATAPVVALASPYTETSILSYKFTAADGRTAVELYARSGYDSAMGDVLPGAGATPANQVTVAGRTGWAIEGADRTQVFVTDGAGLHYRFTIASRDKAVVSSVIRSIAARS